MLNSGAVKRIELFLMMLVKEGTAIVCYIAPPLLKLKDEGTAMLLSNQNRLNSFK